MKLVYLLIILLSNFNSINNHNTIENTTYYVSKKGSNDNKGSQKKPFLTINHAAQIAMPGDSVIVTAGVYRERINPARGGHSEKNRIVYMALPGDDVRVLGSERSKNWQKTTNNNVWKLVKEGGFFDKNNAFRSLTRNPTKVKADESGDGWGWLKYGRWTHRGDVIIDGKGLTEKENKEALQELKYTWYTEADNSKTVIYANFGLENPNTAQTELSLRTYAFFPEKTNINYITVKGFTFMNIANFWAPPTVFQPGAVGSNGGHHWIIEDNIITYSKALGVSIGVPNKRYKADNVGHHIVRNNVIVRCGQGAVAGHQWSHNSQIYNNVVEDINYRKEFGGWETAGLKFHHADSITLRKNFVKNVFTKDLKVGAAHGIWNDYENRHWNITQNTILDVDGFGILMEANFTGPNLIANNIVANCNIGMFSTRGDAFVNNLLINASVEWENQPWGNRIKIDNTRWLQNIFMGGGFKGSILDTNSVYKNNVYLDKATKHINDFGFNESTKSTKIKYVKKSKQFILDFDFDSNLLKKEYPIVTNKILNLPFSFDASVSNDFYGNKRSAKNIPGPFSELKAGNNSFVMYTFPALYDKMKTIIRD